MASPQSAVLGEMYKQWLATLSAHPDMSTEETRRLFEHWGDVTTDPGEVDYIESAVGGVRGLWARPKAARDDRALLCFHGGGYMVGSMYSHRKMYAHIAKVVGALAFIVDYRRTPEHRHPVPVNDCTDAYAGLLQDGFAPEHMAFVGDSAGGALTITTMLNARARGLPLPAAALPISPWTDIENTGQTMVTNEAKDHLVKRSVNEGMAVALLGEVGDRKDPLAAPIHADLSGLPPVYVQTGGDETLLDDNRDFVAKIRAQGGQAKMDVYPDMQHIFQAMAGTAPEADQAIADMAAWVRPLLGLA